MALNKTCIGCASKTTAASAGRIQTGTFALKKTLQLEGPVVEMETELQVLDALKHAVRSYPSVKAWAIANHIQPKNVYQVLASKRSIPDNIVFVLGYVKVKAFKRIKEK